MTFIVIHPVCFRWDSVAKLPYNCGDYSCPPLETRHQSTAELSYLEKASSCLHWNKLWDHMRPYTATSAHTHAHTHTLTLSLLHPSSSICSQAVTTFWWISQAYYLAQVNTGADYFRTQQVCPQNVLTWKLSTFYFLQQARLMSLEVVGLQRPKSGLDYCARMQ